MINPFILLINLVPFLRPVGGAFLPPVSPPFSPRRPQSPHQRLPSNVPPGAPAGASRRCSGGPWRPPPGPLLAVRRTATDAATSSSSSSPSSGSSSSPELMGGTSTFESWFRSKAAGGRCSDGLRHALFRGGSLRGLQYDGGDARGVVELPERLVLRADYSRNKEGREMEDWDSKLAVMLARECLKGEESDLYGYCTLLTRGVPFASVPVPPPTAPDALRHWTPSQLSRLKRSPPGEKLVKTAKNQARRWSDGYASLPPEDRSTTTEAQFLWAMEAVHSRAFRGNFGGGLLNQFQKLTVPFVAAAFGLIVLLADSSETADLIAQVCGLLVLGPALLSVLEEGNAGPGGGGLGKKDAVLLPFIDSANHLEKAESRIDYDPVNGKFLLDLGRNCLVQEDDGRTQLYISYGMRSDKELLLNYGFLPGGDGEGAAGSEGGEAMDDEEAATDRRRARLAERFLMRNP